MAITKVFHRATVVGLMDETPEARTLVLEPHERPFPYRAGQFCTFQVTVAGQMLYRSYSMSSAPEADAEVRTTIKRVPGGQVSNWLLDNVDEGHELTLTSAAGSFCLRPATVPLLAFAGGSGITPILSLAKSALATTDRRVRLLCADRDRASMMFEAALTDLVGQYGDRLSVVRHIDAERGLIDADMVLDFVRNDGDADSYLCGPEPFMAVVKAALSGPGRVFVEDFAAPAPSSASTTTAAGTAATAGTVTIVLDRKTASIPRTAGETLLDSARRAGLSPPSMCEAGHCGTCMARVTRGRASMRMNEALLDDEVAEGYVLTCQAVPDTHSVTVEFE